MPLQLKFHGALETVTGSCHFFRVKASGNIYAVDCGATQGEDEDEQLAIPRNLPSDCYPDKLSGIILTHAHGDHISHLPRWFEAGFKGRIICTKETAILTEIALKDGKKIETRNEKWDVNEKSFKDTIEALIDARRIEPGRIEILENNVTIEAAPTSHLLGCCAFRIVAKDKDSSASILFTGDIGPIEHEKENQSLYAERKQTKNSSDYIISESTYGNRPRTTESQSGRHRQARVCEIISKAFRHGNESVLIIPAFSLQRTLDILLDVFCALQYNRTEIGLPKSCIPKIIIRSPLSWDYAQVYRDAFFSEIQTDHVFFNKYALIRKIICDAGENDLDVIEQLIPHNDRANGFRGHRLISRRNDADDCIETELLWGGGNTESDGPTIIISASGMTHTGPILDLMEEYLRKDTATFVLCGYVPPKSPGGQLRNIWPQDINIRAAKAIKLPKDRRSEKPQIIIPGDEIKCGFESISEFYSGHADGPSIIRYILGDKLERSETTKGIFLVHGDPKARAELDKLIKQTGIKNGVFTPKVYCPKPGLTWFDCETGEFISNSSSALPNLSNNSSDETSNSFELVDSNYSSSSEAYEITPSISYEVETCVVLSNLSDDKNHLIQQIKGAFDFARPDIRGNGLLLKLGHSGKKSAFSTVLIELKEIGDNLLKISTETRLKQVRSLSEIDAISFDWRRLLNLFAVSKEQHYAGVRWCQTDAEIERLINICSPSVFGTKQRRQPVLIIHEDTFRNSELQSIERLITPSVFVAVVHGRYIETLNNKLGLIDEYAINRDNPVYLPIKLKSGAQLIYTDEQGLDIEKLCDLVTADTHIVSGREPLISRPIKLETYSKKPDVSTQSPDEKINILDKKQKINQSYELFTSVVTGLRVKGKIEHLNINNSKNRIYYALIRLHGSNIKGMLHSTQMLSSFSNKEGDEIELCVRHVDAEKREVYFTQQTLSLPTSEVIEAANSGVDAIPTTIHTILKKKVSIDAICKSAIDSLLLQGKSHCDVKPDTQLDRSTFIDTYNKIVYEFRLVDTQSIPSPEPEKGVTFGDIAKALSYTINDIINAAGHMISDPHTYQLGMTILPAGFAPTENSSFPKEYADAFIKECRLKAKKESSKHFDLNTDIKPDCFSITNLAKSMGITEANLVTLMTQKGVSPKVQVILEQEDIKKLEIL